MSTPSRNTSDDNTQRDGTENIMSTPLAQQTASLQQTEPGSAASSASENTLPAPAVTATPLPATALPTPARASPFLPASSKEVAENDQSILAQECSREESKMNEEHQQHEDEDTRAEVRSTSPLSPLAERTPSPPRDDTRRESLQPIGHISPFRYSRDYDENAYPWAMRPPPGATGFHPPQIKPISQGTGNTTEEEDTEEENEPSPPPLEKKKKIFPPRFVPLGGKPRYGPTGAPQGLPEDDSDKENEADVNPLVADLVPRNLPNEDRRNLAAYNARLDHYTNPGAQRNEPVGPELNMHNTAPQTPVTRNPDQKFHSRKHVEVDEDIYDMEEDNLPHAREQQNVDMGEVEDPENLQDISSSPTRRGPHQAFRRRADAEVAAGSRILELMRQTRAQEAANQQQIFAESYERGGSRPEDTWGSPIEPYDSTLPNGRDKTLPEPKTKDKSKKGRAKEARRQGRLKAEAAADRGRLSDMMIAQNPWFADDTRRMLDQPPIGADYFQEGLEARTPTILPPGMGPGGTRISTRGGRRTGPGRGGRPQASAPSRTLNFDPPQASGNPRQQPQQSSSSGSVGTLRRWIPEPAVPPESPSPNALRGFKGRLENIPGLSNSVENSVESMSSTEQPSTRGDDQELGTLEDGGL